MSEQRQRRSLAQWCDQEAPASSIRGQQNAKAKEVGRIREIPTNHNPAFAPVLHPTLETGVTAMVVA